MRAATLGRFQEECEARAEAVQADHDLKVLKAKTKADEAKASILKEQAKMRECETREAVAETKLEGQQVRIAHESVARAAAEKESILRFHYVAFLVERCHRFDKDKTHRNSLRDAVKMVPKKKAI